MTMRRFSIGVMGLIVAAALSLPRAARAEDQPHMQAALDALKQAQQHLQEAQHDKGGHRSKALQHVKMAIAQVEAGMKFDSTHESKKEAQHQH